MLKGLKYPEYLELMDSNGNKVITEIKIIEPDLNNIEYINIKVISGFEIAEVKYKNKTNQKIINPFSEKIKEKHDDGKYIIYNESKNINNFVRFSKRRSSYNVPFFYLKEYLV